MLLLDPTNITIANTDQSTWITQRDIDGVETIANHNTTLGDPEVAEEFSFLAVSTLEAALGQTHITVTSECAAADEHTHFHVVVIDGVFEPDPEQGVRFIAAQALDADAVRAVQTQAPPAIPTPSPRRSTSTISGCPGKAAPWAAGPTVARFPQPNPSPTGKTVSPPLGGPISAG
jgi:hypothetical protein